MLHWAPTLMVAAVFAVVASNSFAQGDALSELGFRPGSPVPDIVLPRLKDGAPASLADFRGKKLVVLHFASW